MPKKLKYTLYGFILLLFTDSAIAQIDTVRQTTPLPSTEKTVDIFLPEVEVNATKRRHRRLTEEEKELYWRRVRDVKKVLPFARKLSQMMIETYEYCETLPPKERKKHLKRVEKDMVEKYTPVMKTWTLSQGRLLIKLMDRETGSSGFQIVRAIYGSWTAGWYNLMARFYGGNLRERYQPDTNEDDAVTERIIYLYENGIL